MIKINKRNRNSPRWVEIAALVISAFSAYKSNQASGDAADLASEQANQQRKALEAQQRSANVQAQQERIKQIRESRIARARIIAQSTASGMGPGTSSVAGATGSIQSTAASNIGSINVAQSFSEQASNANINAANLAGQVAQRQAVAAQWQTLSNLGFSAFGQMGGWNSFNPEVKPAAASRTVSTNEFMGSK